MKAEPSAKLSKCNPPKRSTQGWHFVRLLQLLRRDGYQITHTGICASEVQEGPSQFHSITLLSRVWLTFVSQIKTVLSKPPVQRRSFTAAKAVILPVCPSSDSVTEIDCEARSEWSILPMLAYAVQNVPLNSTHATDCHSTHSTSPHWSSTNSSID